MDGRHVFTARVVEIREDSSRRVGRVSVRGACVDVALDLVPGARAGDDVLVHAGVALSIVGDPVAGGAAGEGES